MKVFLLIVMLVVIIATFTADKDWREVDSKLWAKLAFVCTVVFFLALTMYKVGHIDGFSDGLDYWYN